MNIRAATAGIVIASIVCGQSPAPSTPQVLADATPVRLRLARDLSSNTERQGNTVDFEVVEEVTVNGAVIIPRGATAIGTISDATKARRLGRAGKLDVAIDYVRTPANEKIPLRGVRESEGGSNTGKMTGAIVATSIMFFPAAPLFLMWKGKEYKVPKGTEISAYVNGDFTVDRARYEGLAASGEEPARAPAR